MVSFSDIIALDDFWDLIPILVYHHVRVGALTRPLCSCVGECESGIDRSYQNNETLASLFVNANVIGPIFFPDHGALRALQAELHVMVTQRDELG